MTLKQALKHEIRNYALSETKQDSQNSSASLSSPCSVGAKDTGIIGYFSQIPNFIGN